MKKQTVKFAVESEHSIITNIGKSTIYQPSIKFKGGSISWFDDSKLIKKTNK